MSFLLYFFGVMFLLALLALAYCFDNYNQEVKDGVVDNPISEGYLKFNEHNCSIVIKQLAEIFEKHKDNASHIVYKDLKFRVQHTCHNFNSNKGKLYLSLHPEKILWWINLSQGTSIYNRNYFKCEVVMGLSRSTDLHSDFFRLEDLQTNQQVFNLLQDIVKDYAIEQTVSWKIDKELERFQDYFDKSKEYFGNEYYVVKRHGWLSLNNGDYYMKGNMLVYDYRNDFNCITRWEDEDRYLSILQSITAIEKCDNPKKTHWKHFLELEMKQKKQRELACHSFVDDVLKLQQEYNDLQLTYEMLPTAQIVDYNSFVNFCKIVHKEVEFEDYEITNYLLTKGIKHS